MQLSGLRISFQDDRNIYTSFELVCTLGNRKRFLHEVRQFILSQSIALTNQKQLREWCVGSWIPSSLVIILYRCENILDLVSLTLLIEEIAKVNGSLHFIELNLQTAFYAYDFDSKDSATMINVNHPYINHKYVAISSCSSP